MTRPLLAIRNLNVSIEGKAILKGIDLEIAPGETHAIMGPNGSGKSTLAGVLAGREEYTVERGEVLYDGEPLLPLSVEERAWKGLFLGFQYPPEIPGVSNIYFLKTALNAHRHARGEPEIDAFDFSQKVREKLRLLEMEEDFLYRYVNVGFSGGEKKRNELLQMLLLEPRLCILDEIDSGLDVDALQLVARGITAMRSEHRGFLLITHYQRLLNYVEPDRVHVLIDGRVVRSGGPELAREVERRGYGWLEEEVLA